MGKREIILETANRLFETFGFSATGVDKIAAESGVTKRTLYRHFGCKEGLIEAVLLDHHRAMMEHTRAQINAQPAQGDARLIACFELYRQWFARSTFSGCIFIKTLNEFGKCSRKLSAIASQSKFAMRDLLAELAQSAGAREPELLADQLQILLEGSIVVAQMGRGADVVDVSEAMASDLIARALG